ncbi:hypothetical protein FRX31_013001 [Thalictrum thalictroides]|uniref:RING-type E3 ubiquitin transferase n=1 Tax=Thalictrum thalictroides TaxID=46969 RepID=A0A7J6WMT6_THATH|nr:hypothetical protein FRX31_013001 [Thalictrum thalictroides]
MSKAAKETTIEPAVNWRRRVTARRSVPATNETAIEPAVNWRRKATAHRSVPTTNESAIQPAVNWRRRVTARRSVPATKETAIQPAVNCRRRVTARRSVPPASGGQIASQVTNTKPSLQMIKKILVGPKVFVMEGGEDCSICLEHIKEGDDARTIDCNHTFHADCISEWVEQQATCPLCRFDMYSTLNSRKRKFEIGLLV